MGRSGFGPPWPGWSLLRPWRLGVWLRGLLAGVTPKRLATTIGVAGCLGLAVVAPSAVAPTRAAHTDQSTVVGAPADHEATAQHAAPSAARAGQPAASQAAGSSVVPNGQSTSAQGATKTGAGAGSASSKAATATGPAGSTATARTAPVPPKPVAGLSQTQMNNAQRIVATGKALRMPKRALVIAVACAMQESNLVNLASQAIPESFRYPHEGSGSDHDSVGLFQQRPSAGWGAVRNLMRPAYAATQFYRALRKVPGWQRMALTYAAQAVQGSAYPLAYAKHESRAQAVVDSLT